MPERSFANHFRVKPCAFQEYVYSICFDAAVQSTENSGDTHRLFIIADHNILRRQFSFLFIQRYEKCSFIQRFYDYFFAFYGISIKSMQWLASFMKNEIGDIYDVTDRAKTY